MAEQQVHAADPRTIVSGRGLVECPRWHDGAFWFADWTAGTILRLSDDYHAVIFADAAAPPLSFDFAADGSMFVVERGATRLQRVTPGGPLVPFADLGGRGWNEIVVDGRGNIYVNGPQILLVRPNGRVLPQAANFAFPNGMAVLDDNHTLVVAESHGRRLTAFDIGEDGTLSNRRLWADLGDGVPDGICADETGAIWYADVPNCRCRRVAEGGGMIDEIGLDRGAFACMLGGPGRRTLLIAAAKWFGMEHLGDIAGTGQLLTIGVPAGGAGWP